MKSKFSRKAAQILAGGLLLAGSLTAAAPANAATYSLGGGSSAPAHYSCNIYSMGILAGTHPKVTVGNTTYYGHTSFYTHWNGHCPNATGALGKLLHIIY